jgi:hypothetical protein
MLKEPKKAVENDVHWQFDFQEDDEIRRKFSATKGGCEQLKTGYDRSSARLIEVPVL